MNYSVAPNDSQRSVVLITNSLQKTPAGGRELLCKLNFDLLKNIYGERLLLIELPRVRLQGLKSVIDAFYGYIDGVSSTIIKDTLQIIKEKGVHKVFIDGSNLGKFSEIVKQRFPEIEVSTFFHNVESRFFLGSFRQNITLRSLAVLMVNYLAEKKSVRYSNKLICLSERDSRLLQKVYGRSATHISPMALEDKMPCGFGQVAKPQKEKFALFVGGTFYANRAGITWFVENVAPHIHIKTCIVGRGFEGLREELEREGKVEVVGAVDQLAAWYQDAHFVIAPIFDGSGMKTKVAEALMYGKKIIGTSEAFSGYEEISTRAGRICNTVDDFVKEINAVDNIVKNFFDPELRAIYEEKFSLRAAQIRLENIMNS